MNEGRSNASAEHPTRAHLFRCRLAAAGGVWPKCTFPITAMRPPSRWQQQPQANLEDCRSPCCSAENRHCKSSHNKTITITSTNLNSSVPVYTLAYAPSVPLVQIFTACHTQLPRVKGFPPIQKHFLCTMVGPDSSNSDLLIHIYWKVESDARMDPPIHTEKRLSAVAITLTRIADGASLEISAFMRSARPWNMVVPPDSTMF